MIVILILEIEMKEEKSWSVMTEEEWKAERERIKKIQKNHYAGFGEVE